MIDEEKSTQLNPIYVWAIAEEYFTITQTCQLLRVSVNRIRSYIERDEDPRADEGLLHPQGRPARVAHAEHGDGARREGQSWLAENETVRAGRPSS